MVPAAVVLALVLAEVVAELAAIIVVPILLLPLAVFAARWDTAALEETPVVPIGAPAAEPGEVVRYRSLPSSLFAAFIPVFACVLPLGSWRWSSSAAGSCRSHSSGSPASFCAAASPCTSSSCWDAIVVRNPIRTYLLPWRDVQHVFLGANGTISFHRADDVLAVDALATQLRLKREFVRELRRFAAAHDHVEVDPELERTRS